MTVLPGANYGEYWPDGSGYDSTTLPAGLPDDVLLFTRVSQDGRIAGKGHATGAVRYWDGRAWSVLTTAITPNAPVAFHPVNGDVYVACGDGVHVFTRLGVAQQTIPGYVGSQGLRNVLPDGSVVTGDASYGDGTINEFTDLPVGRIGQGHDHGGIVARIAGVLRLGLTGPLVFVRANQIGDRVAIYGTDFRDGFLILTSTEAMASWPIVSPAIAVPAPLPSLAPIPVPEVSPVSLPNHLDVVQRERAKYPTMIDDATCFAVTNAVANDPAVKADGWGLTSPPAGNGVTVNGRLYRIDKLSNQADGGHICDVLGSSGTGGATAQWDDGRDANGASQWAPAVTATPAPAPTPIPTPQPSADLTAITARVSALELLMQHLADQVEQIQGTSVPVSALAAYAKHGDAVSVTGHVAVYGLKSSDATWMGKIL